MFDWRVSLIAPPNKSFQRDRPQLASHEGLPFSFMLLLSSGGGLIRALAVNIVAGYNVNPMSTLLMR
jgi:hypothetical protein